jgi:hypothetical protein
MDNSPYLDLPLLPIIVALPRMLMRIERDLPTARPEGNASPVGGKEM